MSITMVEKLFQFFDLRMREFAKHKSPILHWVFLFYKETFQRMFLCYLNPTSNMVWTFSVCKNNLIILYYIIFIASNLHLITIAAMLDHVTCWIQKLRW